MADVNISPKHSGQLNAVENYAEPLALQAEDLAMALVRRMALREQLSYMVDIGYGPTAGEAKGLRDFRPRLPTSGHKSIVVALGVQTDSDKGILQNAAKFLTAQNPGQPPWNTEDVLLAAILLIGHVRQGKDVKHAGGKYKRRPGTMVIW